MNKIFIIIQREYLTRVRKKSFIIMTLLTPLLMVAFLGIPVWLSGMKDTGVKNIAVIDQTGKYESAFQTNETYRFHFLNQPIHSVQEEKDYYALIVISDDLAKDPSGVSIYSENQIGLELRSYIAGILNAFVEDEKLKQYNIPHLKEIIEEAKTHVEIKTIKWSDSGAEVETSSELTLIIGMITALLIYFFLLVYGAQVMQGVLEEKTNRIVEIIVSSVKPFELMIGKIIGVALVGLTQFLIWIVLATGLWGAFGDVSTISFSSIAPALSSFDFVTMLIFFIIYFLGGYLLYASLFAAIGAASDNNTDTQQFMMPVMLPVIFAMIAAMHCANNPDGPLAFWTSLIPFTSPVVMMVRIPAGVPAWELIVSIAVLLLSFIGTTWVAAKIYRTGILMYGKKITYGEIWKWIKYK
jgi:ABC-2 type transport system permease protein